MHLPCFVLLTLLLIVAISAVDGSGSHSRSNMKSSKRGMECTVKTLQTFNVGNPDRCRPFQVQSMATWFYSWGMSLPDDLKQCVVEAEMEFVPMVWGKFAIKQLNSTVLMNKTRTLLGFNEPNHKEQANLTPYEAALLWKPIQDFAKMHNLRLGSPCPASCGGNSTKCLEKDEFEWFDKWQARCRELDLGRGRCEFDFLAIHKYTCNVKVLEAYINQWANRFPDKKIWLTEFSCPYEDNVEKIASFVREAVIMMDRHPQVERYGYFTTRVIEKKKKMDEMVENLKGSFMREQASLLYAGLQHLTPVGMAYYFRG